MFNHYGAVNASYLVCFDSEQGMLMFCHDYKSDGFVPVNSAVAREIPLSIKQVRYARKNHHEFVDLYGKHDSRTELRRYDRNDIGVSR